MVALSTITTPLPMTYLSHIFAKMKTLNEILVDLQKMLSIHPPDSDLRLIHICDLDHMVHDHLVDALLCDRPKSSEELERMRPAKPGQLAPSVTRVHPVTDCNRTKCSS